MVSSPLQQKKRIRRVRAILLTDENSILFIKRVKPDGSTPYWVAPGGGVESDDISLTDALHRELYEELGATAKVLDEGFVLRHSKAGKLLEEHFFICHLLQYDLDLRDGPEFDDPTRGEYLPDEIALTHDALAPLNIKTDELKDWLLNNLSWLRSLI